MEKSTTLRDFQVVGKLGQGAFGQVYKVKRKADGQIYAMKKIKIASMKPKERDNALNEVRILASYNGDYIIGYKESFYDDTSATLCIVMQFATGGDLLKMTQNHTKKRTKINESEVWKALVHMTQGLRSLHQKKILHRDLKCANVFITSDGVYKLGDLNVSKVLKKDMAKTQTGTPYYASPEVWKDRPYGVKSDMWSLGCVLYEMAAQRPPFTATDLPGLYKKICAGHYSRIPATYSNDLAKVIGSLLKLNPNERPNTQQLLQNPLVHKHYQGEIDVKPKEKEEEDFLLKTLKVNHGNLRSIKNILPKANYQGQALHSRSRANSIERIKTDADSKEIKQVPRIKQNPSIVKSESSKSLKDKRQKQQKKIDNYLEIKRKHEEKQRQKLIEQLKNQKENLIRKRQRVLSACGMRKNNSQISLEKSPKKNQLHDKKQQVAMTPAINRKDHGVMPPLGNKNLPPRPNANNSYKLPPKPTHLSSQRNHISVEYSRPITSRERSHSRERNSREKSKQNLIKAGQQILGQDPLKSPKVGHNPSNRVGRCSSAQKIVYPSWWID